jgi:hypothetical protein
MPREYLPWKVSKMPSRKLHLVSEWKDESTKVRASYDRMAPKKAALEARILELQDKLAILADRMHTASERCTGIAGHMDLAEKLGAIAFEVVRDPDSGWKYLVYYNSMGEKLQVPKPDGVD